MTAPFDPSRKTIAMTHEFFPYRGGIATWVEEVAAAAVALGHDLEVWCPAHSQLDPTRYPFRVVPMPVPGGQGVRQQLALARFLRTRRRDWEHAQLLLPEPGPIRTFMNGARFGLPAPARTRVVLHGTEIVRLSRRAWTRGPFRRFLSQVERVIVVSHHNRTLLLAEFPELAERTHVAHAAPRTDLSLPSRRDGRDRAPAGELAILTVGRISPRKGQLAMVEAIGRLPAAVRARIVYRLAGQTNNELYRRWLVAAAHWKGVRLEMLGKVADRDLPTEYGRADVFAMTSKEYLGSIEGFGLVYLEAGLFELPVLAHDTGGVADAVVDGKTGFLVAPDDRGALTAAIRRFAEEPALRRQMGEANAAWAQTFSWARTARGVLA